MLRVEFYIGQLVKHNALCVDLISNETVCFHFRELADRRSQQPISHDQVVKLVEEIAPTDVLATIHSKGAGTFEFPGALARVQLEVAVESAERWVVKLTPAGLPTSRSMPAQAGVPAIDFSSAKLSASPQSMVPERVATAKAASLKPSDTQVEMVPGEPKINWYLRRMVHLGASDLHLSAKVKPMMRLDGDMQPLGDDPEMPSEELRNILLEFAPARNKEEIEQRWDTDFAHTIEGLARFRVNFFVDRHGMGAVFRQIPFKILSAEQLGIPKQVLDLCWLSKGLVLVTGPTGSGKSTTLATLIDYINRNRSDHIITIEDPIEFVHDNKKCLVNQREVNSHTQGFKNALRAALREDPDIVLVGELRDLETIAIAIETAETGHLVFGTLHTSTAPSTIDRVIDQFPADRQEQIRVMLSESLKGVIAQVLCKKKSGGRQASYEILIGTSAVSNLIREGKTFQLMSVMQTGKNLGMQSMNEGLMNLVKSGQVDAKEAYVKAVDKQGIKAMFQQANIALDLSDA